MNDTKIRNGVSAQMNKKIFTSFEKSGLLSKGSTSSASDESLSTNSSPLPSPTDFDSANFQANGPLDLSRKSISSLQTDNEHVDDVDQNRAELENDSVAQNLNLTTGQINPALIAAASAMLENFPAPKNPNANISLLAQGFNSLNCFSNLFKFPNFYMNYLNNLNESSKSGANVLNQANNFFPQFSSNTNLSEILINTMKSQEVSKKISSSSSSSNDSSLTKSKKISEAKNVPSPLNVLNNSVGSSASSSASSSSISSPSFPQLNDFNMNLLNGFKNEKDMLLSSLMANSQLNGLFSPASILAQSLSANPTSFHNEAYAGILSNLQINPQTCTSDGSDSQLKQPVRTKQQKQKLDEQIEQEVYTSYCENDDNKEAKQPSKKAKIDTSGSLSNSNSVSSISNLVQKPKKGPKVKSLDGKSPLEIASNLKPAIDPTSIKPEVNKSK